LKPGNILWIGIFYQKSFFAFAKFSLIE
jgi:hypothetical protein